MRTTLLLFLAAGAVGSAFGQMNSPQAELASLREDVRGLLQRVGELQGRVEQLERDNSTLRQRVVATEDSVVTLRQLNDAVSDMNRSIQSAVSASESRVLRQVAQQMETLARQTNAAIESVSRNAASRAQVQTSFTKDYPSNGIPYTVQGGDTLSTIARRFNIPVDDIVNANEIPDRDRLQVGQTLFLPGAR
jgi:LysM repeat protein